MPPGKPIEELLDKKSGRVFGICNLARQDQTITKTAQGILGMVEPRTAKQLRGFVVIVNYYKSLWPKRSLKMVPLLAMAGKGATFKWTADHTKVFKDVQRMVAQDTMPTHPDLT